MNRLLVFLFFICACSHGFVDDELFKENVYVFNQAHVNEDGFNRNLKIEGAKVIWETLEFIEPVSGKIVESIKCGITKDYEKFIKDSGLLLMNLRSGKVYRIDIFWSYDFDSKGERINSVFVSFE